MTTHQMAPTGTTPDFPQPVTPVGTPDPALLAAARTSPVLRVSGPGGYPAWLVAGDEAAREVLSSHERFTSVPPTATEDQRASSIPLVGMDPPDHTRLRSIAQKAFTAGQIRAVQPTIDRTSAALCADMRRAGPPVDLVSAVAYPLPLRVVFELLGGIPDELHTDLQRWIDVFISLDSHTFEEIGEAVDQYQGCLEGLVEERSTRLGNDPLSDLIRAADDEGVISRDEVVGTCGLLIVAGYETTAKAISRGVLALLEFGYWDDLAADRLDVKRVVEEVLRHQAPNTAITRHAAADMDFYGHRIRKGEPFFVSTHLANHDESARDQPLEFDPRRTTNSHTTFGHGVHFCLGAPLARAELATILPLLAREFPGLHLTGPAEALTWSSGSWLTAPSRMEVAW